MARDESPRKLPPQSSPEDSAAVCEQEDERLLRDLVHSHNARLQRFIMRHIGNSSDAEDLTQQAFVEAVRSYRSFRGESQLSTWLYGIALNLVRNHLSRAPERRHQFVGEQALFDEATPEGSPDILVEQSQTLRLLQESLDELPENMRQILLMVGVDELSYEEAAALLAVPIGTVRSRLSRARSALREKIQAKGLKLDF